MGRNVRQTRALRARRACRLSTYRHRFARAAPAPRAKRNDEMIQRIVDVRRPSSAARGHQRLLSLPQGYAGLTTPDVALQPRAQRA